VVGYPKRKVACMCGKAMHQTHSKKDWDCYECGVTVSFHVDPEGTWSTLAKSHGQAVQDAVLRNHRGESEESDLTCMQSEPDEPA
jgi:hypothetical protein